MKRYFLSSIATDIKMYSDVCYFKVEGKTHKRKVNTRLGLPPVTKNTVIFQKKTYEIR